MHPFSFPFVNFNFGFGNGYAIDFDRFPLASNQPLGRVLLDGMRPAFAGLALGIVGGIAASQLIRTPFYDNAPLDAPVFFSVTAILLAVACAGCLLPAWRASRLDPLAALRTE